jgi:Flp pilus assembly protein TadD
MQTAASPVPAAASPEFKMTRVNIAAAFIGGAVLLTPFAAITVEYEDNPAAVELDPDYAAGKKAIEAKQWSAAIAALSTAALRDTRNADIQNYLGYAYRNAGQLDAAFRHYERALTLSPRHRGAHEYVGEAYLMVNNLAKAEEHLAALQQICLIPCEEFEELKEKIEAYKRSGKR